VFCESRYGWCSETETSHKKFESVESHLIRFVALVKIKLDIDFRNFFL
jgi:hypothetical protein